MRIEYQFSLRDHLASELVEAKKLFDWALSYERKGLVVAAEALRDEARKSYIQYLKQVAFFES